MLLSSISSHHLRNVNKRTPGRAARLASSYDFFDFFDFFVNDYLLVFGQFGQWHWVTPYPHY